MKLIRNALYLSLVATSMAAAAAIDKPMVISTGSPTGDYNPMINNVVTYCRLQDQVKVLESGGSLDNNTKIFGPDPTATAGVFQLDFALYMRDRDQKWLNNMVAVARLHDEYLQILTLNKAVESGGVSVPWVGKVGGKSIVLNDFSNLKGQTVYAWGGSFYSANVLSEKFNLNLKVVDLSGTTPDGKGGFVKVEKDAKPQQVAAMLVAQGQGAAVITVGSPNLKWLTTDNGYGKQWKLLPVGSSDHAKVGGIYGLKSINYLGLSGGEVQTLTVPAVLMTRAYQSEERVRPILAVQNCIKTKIVTLRDEGNTNWLSVDPKAAFESWKKFEVPAELAHLAETPVAAPAAAASSKPTPKKK